MPAVKRLKRLRSKALQAPRPKLFDIEPVAQRSPRELIKACVRSGYQWTETEQWILKDLLEVVNKFGRLPAPQHKLLMVFARKAGVE